jgi:holo-[acyl-carrier protein] synthase
VGVVIRVGVDLLMLDELDRLLGRRWFDRFCFAGAELAEAGGLTGDRRREYLAGRFAAKEAVLKVLGLGLFQGVVPREIAVVREVSGAPRIDLTGQARAAADRARLTTINVSITHKRDLVCALAVGWAAAGPPEGGTS